MSQAILVWDVPTRFFHWCLVGVFSAAMLSADSKSMLLAHAVFGYLLLALICFRLIWGIVGSRYARFSEFVRTPAAVIAHLRAMINGNPGNHVGHNPLGALAIVGLLTLGIIVTTSGVSTFNGFGGKPVEKLHEAVAYLMLAIALAHVIGVIASSVLQRENLVKAMATGRKSGSPECAASSGHGMTAIILLLVLAIFAWALARGLLPSLIDPTILAEKTTKVDHHKKHH